MVQMVVWKAGMIESFIVAHAHAREIEMRGVAALRLERSDVARSGQLVIEEAEREEELRDQAHKLELVDARLGFGGNAMPCAIWEH